uniref:Uncharacterized protein n=1 Tax=Panagrolaimus sp. PS1159 TaxID=55785 RepID=A0AC35F3R2_9BILA
MFVQRFLFQQCFAATSKLLNNFVRFSSTSSEASTKDYPVPPRLKYIDGYIRDSRNDRKLRDTFIFGTKNGETKELRIEIADEKDIPLVVQSYGDLFLEEVNIYRHLNSTYDEFAQLFFNRKSGMLSKGLSYIIKDEDKVVGFSLGDIYDISHIDDEFRKQLYSKDAKIEFKDDYAEDIKNAEGDTEKAKKIYAFFEPAMLQTIHFIPPDRKKIFLYESTGIKKDYQKSNLYLTLVDLMHKSAKEKGCDYSVSYCVAKASARQASKFCDHLFSFPFDKFKANGKVVFDSLHDGAKALEVYGLKL